MAARTLYQCSECKNCFLSMSTVTSHKCISQARGESQNVMSVVTTDTLQEYQECSDDMKRTMFQCEQCRRWFADAIIFEEHNCLTNISSGPPCEETQNRATEDQPSTSNDDRHDDTIWTRPPTVFLISQYAMKKELLDRGKLKKKQLWKEISDELGKQQYSFTPEQVNGRWKTLQRNYKAVKDENRKSGSGRKDFPYFSMMDDIFFDDPAVNPEVTLSSACKSSATTSTGGSASTEKSKKLRSTSDDDDEKEQTQNKVKKRKRLSQSQGVLDFLTQYAEKQDERYERELKIRKEEHCAKMSILQSIVESLKK